VCDHPDVAKCLFFKTTRFHPKNEVSISSSWDVGEGISFCDEEVGAGGLVGDFGVRRGAYKQSENMSPPNSQTTREKVREKEDVELGEVCLQNMYRVLWWPEAPSFQPSLKKARTIARDGTARFILRYGPCSSPSLPSEPRIQPCEAESRHLQSQQMQPSFILHFLSTYFLVCIAERSRNTLHCLILRSNEFPVAEL
jgi:hypothetical protein